METLRPGLLEGIQRIGGICYMTRYELCAPCWCASEAAWLKTSRALRWTAAVRRSASARQRASSRSAIVRATAACTAETAAVAPALLCICNSTCTTIHLVG